MIEKRKRLCISLNAKLVKELRQNSKRHKITLSRMLEEIILLNKKYQKEVIPQLRQVRALLKVLKIKTDLKAKERAKKK